jgi:SOS response regulatory protein OraA/RecX
LAQDSEVTAIPKALTPAAERMRRSRKRRRDGMRCVRVELRETEIDALIRSNLLTADARNDLQAIRKALYAHLEDTLGANPWRIK